MGECTDIFKSSGLGAAFEIMGQAKNLIEQGLVGGIRLERQVTLFGLGEDLSGFSQEHILQFKLKVFYAFIPAFTYFDEVQ